IKHILSSFLSPQITEVTVRGERRLPISSAASALGPNKARAFSTTLLLSFIIYRGSVPRQRCPPPGQGRSLSRQTMDSRAGGGSGLIVKDDVTNTRPLTPPDTKQRFKRVKSEGGRQNGNSDMGLRGRGAGAHEWRVCLYVCVSSLYS
ncbi:hypothetical protein GBF38_022308, partial [Nibea albiflora]